jgi:hypothetical protein
MYLEKFLTPISAPTKHLPHKFKKKKGANVALLKVNKSMSKLQSRLKQLVGFLLYVYRGRKREIWTMMLYGRIVLILWFGFSLSK